ncbi:MAG: hypothetical protein COY42_19005 [Armatimonadetes bacterium CG_4_10_14_0_8_um_filter_66_14]|nr:MAG: hypothetical protein COS65_14390 [Armatimonadetes bacterium CG06_land_8_20_14_3_00_66_21]PIZ41618.1 MAG: hypothetical protein COY42_19005 [Armatimonadetes bacterium CG_4_10_14_0_8_um_filter_66_14]PJB60116.1 MAG: hypothetical protein CO096_35615 [Armatimonadetes bacterium CG_4_9_14_3_um_filter_66_14]
MYVADFNLVLVSGVATRNASLRQRRSGIAKAEFSLEVDRPFTRASGAPVSDLFLVDVYGPLAEWCAEEVTEGTRLLLVGTLNKESYVTRHERREHMIVIKCKYLRVVDSREIDFGDLSLDELRQDDWEDTIVCEYLALLTDMVDPINRR